MDSTGFAKPEINSWKPGQPGDAIKGIFTGNVKEFEGQYGKTNIYEVVGIEGEWHNMDDDGKPTGPIGKVTSGEIYSIFSRKTIEDDFKRAKRGQQILIRFTEMRKPKTGGKPYKMVELLLGPMDEVWLKENPFNGANTNEEIPFA